MRSLAMIVAAGTFALSSAAPAFDDDAAHKILAGTGQDIEASKDALVDLLISLRGTDRAHKSTSVGPDIVGSTKVAMPRGLTRGLS